MIAGLHSCKPGNEPVVGHVKSFVIIQNPATETKKGWTKIKAAQPEEGGQPYAITKVRPTGYTDSYGNISFNLEIEPQNGAQAPQDGVQQGPWPPIARTQGAMSRDDYWARKEDFDREREARFVASQPRIERQHSQHMAVILVKTKYPNGIPEGFDLTSYVRDLTDWMQRDIGRSPIKEPEARVIHAEPGEEFGHHAPPEDNDEPPF